MTTHQAHPKLVLLMLLSAFGPYLVGPLRLDHLLYGLALWFSPSILKGQLDVRSPLATILVGWLLICFIAFPQLVTPPSEIPEYSRGSSAANADALLMPLAVLMITLHCVQPAQWEATVKRSAAAVTLIMSANAVMAFISSLLPTPWMAAWWAAAGTEDVTAVRAENMGRYGGLIGQPALAGVLYSLALVCAIYWLRSRPVLVTLAVTTLALGGLLVVSKAFLFIGIPVTAWQLVATEGRRGTRIVALVGTSVGLWYLVGAKWYASWQGADHFATQVPGIGDIISVAQITGGRYGEGSVSWPLVNALFDHQPVFGMGLRGLSAATDAAWIQMLVLAGMAGIVGLSIALVGIVRSYTHAREHLTAPEKNFFLSVVLILIASGLGFPSLTGNRLTVVAWVLIGLLILAPKARSLPGSHSETTTRAALPSTRV